VGIDSLLFSLPSLIRLWVLLSLLIPFLLLYRIEGSQRITWVLPLILLTQVTSNMGPNTQGTLVPKESYLVTHYLLHPLSKKLSLQKKELQQAFEHYLIDTYLNESPSEDPSFYKRQKTLSEYKFTVNRLLFEPFNLSLRPQAIPQILIPLLLSWHLLFAFLINRRKAMDLPNFTPSVG